MNKAGRNALVTSLMVCCGFVVCFTPVDIMFLLSFVGYPVDFSSWFYQFAILMAFTNSCVNPFIYAAKYGDFQQAVRHLISKVNQHQSQVSASG